MIAIPIVIGATVVIFCTIILIYCLQRRRRKRALSQNMQNTQTVKHRWFELLNPFAGCSSTSVPKLPKMDRVSIFGKNGDLEMAIQSIGREDSGASACTSPSARSGLKFRDEYPLSPVLPRELIVRGTGYNVRSHNGAAKPVLLNGVPMQRFKASAVPPPRLPIKVNPTLADEKKRESTSTFETDVDDLADISDLALVKESLSVGTATGTIATTVVLHEIHAKSVEGQVVQDNQTSPSSLDSPFAVGDDEDEEKFEDIKL
jgi:hypothetical protein